MIDMNKIIEIYRLIDWNADEKENRIGIDMAQKIDDLQFFIQPCTEHFNKNVWENCAIILSKKSDSDIKPYMKELFCWLQDMNWPGAQRIYERLIHYKKNHHFIECIKKCEKMAVDTKDEVWLENLYSLKNKRSENQSGEVQSGDGSLF